MSPREDPAEQSDKEKAEEWGEMERGGGQVSQPHKPIPKATDTPGGAGGSGGQSGQHPPGGGGRDDAGGITNRPLDREEREQEELPPRGQAKREPERR